jgi:hypothetical protein
MNQPTTFLERMQSLLEGMPAGPDKDKLLALLEAQDTAERVDVHPKDRARALRRLLQIDAASSSGKGPPARGKAP